MKLFKNLLSSWRNFFRGIVYPTGLLAVIGLAFSLYEPLKTQSLQVNYFVLFWFSVVLIFLLIELLFLSTNKSLRGFKNQDLGIRSLGSIADQIGKSDCIHLLGTTFKSFTDNDENLHALQNAISRGVDVKILMIDPNGEEVNRMLIARQDRNSHVNEDLLRNEILSSISRFENTYGKSTCQKILRFYRATRSISIYRFDYNYFVTCYTHGRGGSSPVITYQARNTGKDEFYHTLVRGFSELWEAKSTTDFEKITSSV